MNIIGLDFDNTLIDYDLLFYKTAVELNIVPENTTKTKLGVREYLLSIGKEKIFTALQGEVYGNKIKLAQKSSGVISTLIYLRSIGYSFKIISHKTRFPLIGPRYDLHKSAINWLKNNNFMSKNGLDMKLEDVHFEPSIEKKIRKIHNIKCKYYIDDLKEILQMISNKVIRIHYDKNNISNIQDENFYTFNNWEDLKKLEIF